MGRSEGIYMKRKREEERGRKGVKVREGKGKLEGVEVDISTIYM